MEGRSSVRNRAVSLAPASIRMCVAFAPAAAGEDLDFEHLLSTSTRCLDNFQFPACNNCRKLAGLLERRCNEYRHCVAGPIHAKACIVLTRPDLDCPLCLHAASFSFRDSGSRSARSRSMPMRDAQWGQFLLGVQCGRISSSTQTSSPHWLQCSRFISPPSLRAVVSASPRPKNVDSQQHVNG
jgi:hypothetical protein